MTDKQFEILDELYFVIDFEQLNESLDLDENTLYQELKVLIKLSWVKCFRKDIELDHNEIDFQLSSFKTYKFLASKKGLFEHNSI
jgi:hypothetical protein